MNNPAKCTSAGGAAAATSSGLIRLAWRKPMGIVFEPMTDPHNPSQQRGVRICDLPRTGAAAMSQKLEVGDELLSINDKTMSRLTFDEIMDFIIEADKERVDLLFRRPDKEKLLNTSGVQVSERTINIPSGGGGPGGMPLSPMGLAGLGSNNSNSVKWIDEKSDLGGKLADDVRDSSGRGGERSRNNGRKAARDEPSVDDDGTYNDGYTVESQSQYTMETYEDDRRGRDRGGRRGGGRGGDSRYSEDESRENDSSRRNRDRRDKRKGGGERNKDPVESTGFLDLLIDTLCTSVMGRDARDMCGDRSESKSSSKDGRGKYRDEDDEDFTVDDGTYATYDEQNDRRDNHRGRRGKNDEDSLVTEEERTYEDDGTQTLESKEKAQQMKQMNKKKKDKSSSKGGSKEEIGIQHGVDMMGIGDDIGMDQFRSDPPPQSNRGGKQSFEQISAPDPPTKAGGQSSSRHHHQPVGIVDIANEQESAIASGIALPVKELEYDDRVDYAADVSVMESLGGPSLLVERARHENAVSTGADRASFEHGHNLDRADPELSELVALHGNGFLPDPDMTKEETAFRDPYKFYEHAVCALLQDNEPEKVRLLSKLMAKYRGRERHLINKLSARYNKDKGGAEGGAGAGSSDQVAAASSSDNRARANSAENATNLANKSSMTGMEKIYEGGEDEEETAGSSALNDPSRANMAAIETAKKKLESSNEDKATKPQDTADISSPKNKSGDNDGWPPAMSDPWGTGRQQLGANQDDGLVDEGPMDDEGSFTDGSSYSGDESGVDGTSPAIIAQVSELLNYVYGKTSVAGQIDRVSTIMRAYEGREAVLLELLETKALIKANADSNNNGGGAADLPASLRNSQGLNANAGGNNAGDENANNEGSNTVQQKKLTPETPVSVLTAPTMAPGAPLSPASVLSPKEDLQSPSAATTNTTKTDASKKKKKSMFGGFFGGKKKDKATKANAQGNFPSSDTTVKTNSSQAANAKKGNKKVSKKGQQLPSNDDDRSI